MDPGEALSTAAQVAITLAGFSGIVATFGERGAGDWTALDKFRLRLMLATSSYPTVMALTGLLFLNTDLSVPTTWRVCSALAAATLVIANLFNARLFRQYLAGALGTTTAGSRWTFLLSGVLGNLTLLGLIANAAWLAAFWPFFFAIIVGIVLAMVQFVRLIVLH